MAKLSDLSTSEKANKGAFLHLTHPADPSEHLFSEDKKPVGFTMLGMDSDVAVAQSYALTDRILDPKAKNAKVTAAQSDEEAAASLAALVRGEGWNIPQGWIDGTDDDTPSQFSTENVVKMFNNKGVKWVREQANRFAGTRANFLKASS